MTYKAIRGIEIYSEAHGFGTSLLRVQVYNLDGTIEIHAVDESEEPVVTELINRLDGTVKAEGGRLEFDAIFDTGPDPHLEKWVAFAAESQKAFRR